MNLTYTGIELQRVGRDFISMFFIAVLPAFMYIVFGAAMAWSDAPVGNGNAAMYTMISRSPVPPRSNGSRAGAASSA